MRYMNDKMGIIDTNSLAISPLKYETNFEPGTLESHLPYTKGSYATSPSQTLNAQRIRACRANKAEK